MMSAGVALFSMFLWSKAAVSAEGLCLYQFWFLCLSHKHREDQRQLNNNIWHWSLKPFVCRKWVMFHLTKTQTEPLKVWTQSFKLLPVIPICFIITTKENLSLWSSMFWRWGWSQQHPKANSFQSHQAAFHVISICFSLKLSLLLR